MTAAAVTVIRAVLPVVAATVMLAGGEPAADLHVERVDDSGYPAIDVVVSAPGLDATGTDPEFRVLDGGDELAVRVASVPADAVEVVLLVVEPEAPDVTVTQLRSAVMDVMLRLPPDASVSLVTAADPPAVLAEPGTTLQDRMLIANRLEPAGQPALREAVDLAVRLFSDADGTVRNVVVVGGAAGQGDDAGDGLASGLDERQVTAHAVEPATGGSADGADRLVERLSNLYRLLFEVGEGAGEVEVRLETGERSASRTVALDAPPDATSTAGSPAAGDGERQGRDAAAVRLPPLPFTLAGLAALVLLSAAIALPEVGSAPSWSPAAESWEQAAAEVARETGADGATVEAAAARVASEREQAAAEIRSAGLEVRLAATVLGVQPVVAAGIVVVLSGGDYDALVAGAWRLAALGAALVLTVAGAAGLRRVARPPYSASPARWQAHDRESAARSVVADTLDRAYLYAVGGLDLDEALARAGAGPDHPARAHPPGEAGDEQTAVVLHRVGTTLRSGYVAAARSQAQAGPAATAVPFLAFSLPAIVLVVVAGWSALGTA